jgi:uncharacterized membrane protein
VRRLAQYFLRGLIVLAPIALTGYVFWVVLRTVDGWFRFRYPGLGLLVTLVGVTLIGFVSSHMVSRGATGLFDRLLDRMPFVRLLHHSIRDLTSAFVGPGKRFDRPVLVELLPGGPRVVGFVTRDGLSSLGLPEHVSVYLPQSYNFAGQLIVVARDRVQPLPAASAETLAFVVSGGVSGAEKRGQTPIPGTAAPPPAP